MKTSGWTMQQRILKATAKAATLKALADIYRHSAERVAQGEEQGLWTHETACSAMMLVANGMGDMAFAAYQYWFGQPRDYWFGRNSVYQPLKTMRPDKFQERIEEVLANQQARIYSLLFMVEMTKTGDVEV